MPGMSRQTGIRHRYGAADRLHAPQFSPRAGDGT
jgi:hypothetical protein